MQERPLNLSLDSLVFAQMGYALVQKAGGSRVQKVQATGDRSFVLHLRRSGETLHLGFFLGSGGAVLTPLRESHSLPAPPPFCTLLRKHLTGARLLSAGPEPLGERVFVLRFAREGEVLGPEAPALVIESMGRDSNVLLLAGDGTILDALRRAGPGDNAYRTVLPGRPYVPPPPSPLPSVATLTADIFPALADRWTADLPAEEALRGCLSGLSPRWIREVLCRCGHPPGQPLADPAPLRLALLELAAAYGTPLPTLHLWEEGSQVFLMPSRPCTPPHPPRELPVLEAVAEAVQMVETRGRFRTLQEQTGKVLKRERERILRKLQKQEAERADAIKDEELRHVGQLLLSHLYLVRPGSTSVEVPDYTKEDAPLVSIPLDPHRTPSQNAQALFARYQKAKRRLERLSAHLEESRRERDYLEALLGQREGATENWELEHLAEEMRTEGYLPRESLRRPLPPAPPPLRYQVGPHLLRVGRNHRENEELWREARPEDLWFHVQNIPGSHVYLVPQGGKPVAEEHLQTAALVAAYHSRARQGSHVPVDMTTRQKVWRPKGAKPGQVLYREPRTLVVTPDVSLLPPLVGATGQEPESDADL